MRDEAVGYGMSDRARKRIVVLTAVALGLFGTAGSLAAQDYDDGDGWWDAEEEYEDGYRDGYGVDFKEDGREVRLRVSGDRDGRRGDERYGEYERDARYDRERRVRGRQRAVVIPGGRVRVRARATGYAPRRDRYHGLGYRPLWRHVDWNVTLREPWGRRHRYDRVHLRDIVGKRTMRRLDRHRTRIGARGPLRYRWRDLGHRGVVLQVRAGGIPIAEFVDFRHDGYVDVVRLSVF